MSNKGTITLGAEDSFNLNLIGNQDWVFSIQPSTDQFFSDANIRFVILNTTLVLNSGIVKDGLGYLITINPDMLENKGFGEFSIFGDTTDPDIHVGFGKWFKQNI